MKTDKSALTNEEKQSIKHSIPSRTLAEMAESKSPALAHERRLNHFKWIPKHERRSFLPGLPPAYFPYKEQRKPLFWLSGGSSCWLVNNSDETLAYVGATTGGFATIDDSDMLTINSSKFRYYYEQVLPNEAVLVEDTDPFYDSDYVLKVYIEIDSPTYGKLEFASDSGKGSISETLFIWDTGEHVKYAQIKKL